MPLITLGGTVDSAFLAALADAFDPFGNLDTNPDVIGTGHSVQDANYPYYPVLRYHTDGDNRSLGIPPALGLAQSESRAAGNAADTLKVTPTETYNPFKSFGEGPDTAFKPLTPGPYPIGTQPDVFFRLNAPVDERSGRRMSGRRRPGTPTSSTWSGLAPARLRFSPLGDPIPFSCHLIAQLANDTGYSTQFNLDSDRAFAYLTWDWIRNDKTPDPPPRASLNLPYQKPVEQPEARGSGRRPLNALAGTGRQGAEPAAAARNTRTRRNVPSTDRRVRPASLTPCKRRSDEPPMSDKPPIAAPSQRRARRARATIARPSAKSEETAASRRIAATAALDEPRLRKVVERTWYFDCDDERDSRQRRAMVTAGAAARRAAAAGSADPSAGTTTAARQPGVA